MAHVRFEPMRDIENIVEHIGGFLNQVGKGISFEVGGYVPRVDIEEDDRNIYVYAELPGVTKDQVKIILREDGTLTIQGEKKADSSEGKKRLRNERSYGNFTRTLLLPTEFNSQNISASFQDGVLSITIPKVEPEKPKEYTVNIN